MKRAAWVGSLALVLATGGAVAVVACHPTEPKQVSKDDPIPDDSSSPPSGGGGSSSGSSGGSSRGGDNIIVPPAGGGGGGGGKAGKQDKGEATQVNSLSSMMD